LLAPDIFTVLRISPEGDQHILTLTNVTSKICNIDIPLVKLDTTEKQWYDLISGKKWLVENQKLYVTMQPYDVIWLKPVSEI
jgi:sucrose phosphorylase